MLILKLEFLVMGPSIFGISNPGIKIVFLGELFQARSLVSVKVIGQKRSDDSPQKATILKNKEWLDQNIKAL